MLGTYPALTVEGEGTSATLTLRGATLIQWQVRSAAGVLDLIDGYRTPEELEAGAGARSAIMAPFSNRIANGRYTFGGEESDFFPSRLVDRPVVMHGLVRDRDFEIDGVVIEDDQATVRFVNRDLRPQRFPQYPYSIDLEVCYTITRDSVSCTIIA